MSKVNPLAGLIANYGDSDDDSIDENNDLKDDSKHAANGVPSHAKPPPVHPAPVSHCPWSACYDENTGHTYYWNQQTNQVTWDAPPEYLLALRLAKQQLSNSGTTEVSAKEWQLYQQALVEKQMLQKVKMRLTGGKGDKSQEKVVHCKTKKASKRRSSDDLEEKIELITSYSNSDSESNEESEKTVKAITAPKPEPLVKPMKTAPKKIKNKPPTVEYGPSLPENQSYSAPIGPELPPDYVSQDKVQSVAKNKPTELDENQDEGALLQVLKDKAKILENLGGEIPKELKRFIGSQSTTLDTNIDDLLDEIEKKELPKVKKAKMAIDIFVDHDSNPASGTVSPRSVEAKTPPLPEMRPLFPSSKLEDNHTSFPQSPEVVEISDTDASREPEKKSSNLYLTDGNEVKNRKKLRISTSVLPERKKSDVPSYTTKYSQYIEGMSEARTGLGFKEDEESTLSPKTTVNYGNGLTFTKGEVLNENQRDERLDDLTDLVEAKLKFLNDQQLSPVAPVQEMLIQMQSLASAFRAGALSCAYWRRWTEEAASALAQHELSAAPQGWTCTFHRESARYGYRRECDGFHQWEYPAVTHTDMDICTTPPPGEEDAPKTPPLPPESPPRAPRVATPSDPPPPGTDDAPPTPPPPSPPAISQGPAKALGDELASFYNDIARLEAVTEPAPPLPPQPPQPPPPPTISAPPSPPVEHKETVRAVKKKSKMKLSSSISMKHKSVSSLVAKWQQVAEEINSD